MLYQRPSFTVTTNPKAVDPATCGHGWINQRGRCQFCGLAKEAIEAAASAVAKVATGAAHLDPADGFTAEPVNKFERSMGPENGYPYITEDDKGRRWMNYEDGSCELLRPTGDKIGSAAA